MKDPDDMKWIWNEHSDGRPEAYYPLTPRRGPLSRTGSGVDFETWCKRMVSMKVARRVRRFWVLPLVPFKKNWGVVIFVGGPADRKANTA